MDYWQAILYGAVQGLAEYLPISSSAHLILFPRFLGIEDPGLTFDVFLHFGTLFSTLIYFWRDWMRIFSTLPWVGEWFHPKGVTRAELEGLHGPAIDWKLLAVATVPALGAGAMIHEYVETAFRGPHFLAWTLAIGGVLLWAADHFLPRRRTLASFRMKDALTVGVAQCFALIPGMSRSGSTMIGGRLLGLDRAAAARFSFLMAGPVTAAAVVYKLKDWREPLDGPIGGGQLAAAGFSSFVFGMIAIGGLLRVVKRFSFLSFAVYRVILALVVWRALVMI